jgi:hypothetical protein
MGEFAAKYRPELDLDEFERRLRAAAPSPQSRQSSAGASDPLAELARLVNGAGERREDPFDALFRAQKAVADGAHPPLQAPHEPYLDSADAAHAHFAAESEPQWAEEPARLDASWASQAPEFAPESQAFAARTAPQAGGRRKVIYAMAALLLGGVALFAGGLALKKGSSSGEVATIQADSDPAKIKPANQDAAASGSGQALFDRKSDNAPAKVVTKAEQPADLAIAAKQARAAGAAANVTTPAPPNSVDPQSASQANGGALMAPRKVKTVSIRADGSLLNGAETKSPRSTLPTLVGGVPGVAPIVPVAKPTPRAAAPSTTEAALQAPSKPKIEASSKPAIETPSKPKSAPEAAEPAASGNWAVQLAGEPSEAEARAAATRFASKYASALQGRHPSFVSAQVGERTIYRVRVGQLSKEAAGAMCNAIKGQGGACFAIKN